MSKGTQAKAAEKIVQYIVVRTDLQTKLNWSFGAVMAQACHASNAVLHRYRDDEYTAEYFKELENLTTVILGAEGPDELVQLDKKLKNVIDCALWIEKPEDVVTALATKPYPKKVVAPHFASFKVFK